MKTTCKINKIPECLPSFCSSDSRSVCMWAWVCHDSEKKAWVRFNRARNFIRVFKVNLTCVSTRTIPDTTKTCSGSERTEQGCSAAVMWVSVADNEGRTNNLRFALSIKISLKGVFKPSANCTSLASYITKQPQWADGRNVCVYVCVCVWVCECVCVDECGAQVSTGITPPAANLTHHLC